jgi:hypothetical protein
VPDGLQEGPRAAGGYQIGYTLAWSVLNNKFYAQILERLSMTFDVYEELDDKVDGNA